MPTALLAAACIHSLYRYKKRLGLLCLAWAVAGILFQQSRAYEAYTQNRKTFADLLPWHAISRVAEQARMPFPIITYGSDLNRLRLDSRFGGSQHEHYFARPGLSLASYADLDSTVRQIRHKAFGESAFWLVFRAQENDADAAASLRSVPLEVNYAPCETRTVGADSAMILYHWAALHCQAPALKAIYQTELANYEFFGSWLDAGKSNLLFIFRWTARTDFAAQDYNISHQLIGTDGEKRAQLDLHLANEGELKQFALDVSEAPAGDYHLVAIVYDSKTNRKLNWQADTGMMPHIQLPVSVTLDRN